MPEHRFNRLEKIGNYMVEGFHLLGLFVIGAAIIWASWAEVFKIIGLGGPKIHDILVLFIYLELGAMVGIYFKTKHLPVRFLLYIAITALTRALALEIEDMQNDRILIVSGAILVLALAILVIRFGSARFPMQDIG